VCSSVSASHGELCSNIAVRGMQGLRTDDLVNVDEFADPGRTT
jgi:hypothetical protein